MGYCPVYLLLKVLPSDIFKSLLGSINLQWCFFIYWVFSRYQESMKASLFNHLLPLFTHNVLSTHGVKVDKPHTLQSSATSKTLFCVHRSLKAKCRSTVFSSGGYRKYLAFGCGRPRLRNLLLSGSPSGIFLEIEVFSSRTKVSPAFWESLWDSLGDRGV